MSNKYNKLLKDIKDYSILCINNFLDILGIDNIILKHLKNVNIVVDEIKDEKSLAMYYPDINTIVLSDRYLSEEKREMTEEGYDYLSQVSVFAITVIHELLHANRTIMINNELSVNNFFGKFNYESENMENFDLLNQYKSLLDVVLMKYDFNMFKRFIPFWIIQDKSYVLVTCYDKKSKKIVEFVNKSINGINLNDENILLKISYDIENNRNNYVKINSYFANFKNINEIDFVSDYFHTNGNLRYLFKNTAEMSNEEFNQLVMDNEVFFSNRFKLMDSFEESLVEGLANIIILSSDFSYINYEYIKDNFSHMSDNACLAIMLFEILGVEYLVWFMLSVYVEYYVDKFSEFFSDDYENILIIFDDLYNERKKLDEVKDEFLSLINNHLVKDK